MAHVALPMTTLPKKLSPSAQASAKRDIRELARAVSFTAHIRKGPFEKYTTETATLDEARVAAIALNAAYGGMGRRAIVYGISPEGWTFVIPDGLQHVSPAVAPLRST